MTVITRPLLFIGFAVLLSGCLSNTQDTPPPAAAETYQHQGEKYAKVVVTLSEEAKADIRRDGSLARLNLDTEIITALKVRELYDPRGRGDVEVFLERVRISDRGDAFALRTLPEPDAIFGEVRLMRSGVELGRFPVKAEYQVGFFRKWKSSRLDWLSRKFAEITGNQIGGKPQRSLWDFKSKQE